jgi:hypothetical protein
MATTFSFKAAVRPISLMRCLWPKFVNHDLTHVETMDEFPQECLHLCPVLTELKISEKEIRFEVPTELLRHIFKTFHGCDPKSFCIRFTCGNHLGLCVNPKHMQLATFYEYQRGLFDARQTQRQLGFRFPSRVCPETNQLARVGYHDSHRGCCELVQSTVPDLQPTPELRLCFQQAKCHHVSTDVALFHGMAQHLATIKQWSEAVDCATQIGILMNGTMAFGFECSQCGCQHKNETLKWHYYRRADLKPTPAQVEHFYQTMPLEGPEALSKLRYWLGAILGLPEEWLTDYLNRLMS